LKEKGYNAKQIWIESQKKGEVLSYRAFSRHFGSRGCWDTKKVYLMKQSTDLAKDLVAKKLIEQMNIIEEIGNSLKLLKDHIDTLAPQVKEGTVDWKNLLGTLAEIRMILKFLWDISEKITIKPSMDIEDFKSKLLEALKEIPFEYVDKIRVKLGL